MNDSRRVVNTTIDSSQYYMQTIPECPICNLLPKISGKIYMVYIWEHVSDDVYVDKTISRYKSGYKCLICEYENVQEVTMTMYITSAQIEFENLVENMRKWQKEYFKHRTDQALQESKKLEKEVDKFLKERNQYNLFI